MTDPGFENNCTPIRKPLRISWTKLTTTEESYTLSRTENELLSNITRKPVWRKQPGWQGLCEDLQGVVDQDYAGLTMSGQRETESVDSYTICSLPHQSDDDAMTW